MPAPSYRRVLGVLAAAAAVTTASVTTAAPASSATGLSVVITCQTPEPWRMKGSGHCVNLTSDRGQTYTATVRTAGGRPKSGVRVRFTESGADAFFRERNRECTTNFQGRCSDEVVETTPTNGEYFRTAVTIIGTAKSDSGRLSFCDSVC